MKCLLIYGSGGSLYINLVICLIFIIVNRGLAKGIADLSFVFNAWWAVVIFGYIISSDAMYPITSNVWYIIGFGIIVFNLVYILRRYGTHKHIRVFLPWDNYSWDNMSYYSKILFWVEIIFFIMMLPMVLRNLPNLLSDGLLGVRSNYMGNSKNGAIMSTVERIVYIHFGVFPGVAACTMIRAILWSRGIIRFKSITIDILNLICIVLITGARTYIFYAAIYFCGAFFLNKKWLNWDSSKKYKRIRRNIVLLIILVAIAGFVITSQRSFGGGRSVYENLRDTLIIYFVGGIKVFDIALSNPSIYGLDNYTYGLLSISGPVSIVMLLVNAFPFIGGFAAQIPSELAQMYLVSNTIIGNHLSMNAFATMYYYFYRDFGIIGVFLGVYVFACICASVSRKNKNYYENKSIILDITFLQTLLLIIFSVCWWEPYRMEFWMILLQAIFWSCFAEKRGARRSSK